MVLGQRARTDARLDDSPILNSAAAARWFVPAMETLDHEELHALYLDRRARPIAYRRVSVGCDRYTIVDPRQVLRPAVELGACSLVVAHNHPSGDPEPSADDIRVTRVLTEAAKILGIQLLDHLVVSSVGWTSLQLRMTD
jgi:DNA repair protein RadC